jgi:hypothetical protein
LISKFSEIWERISVLPFQKSLINQLRSRLLGYCSMGNPMTLYKISTNLWAIWIKLFTKQVFRYIDSPY